MCLARIPGSLIPKLGRCYNEVSYSQCFARRRVKTILILVLLAKAITGRPEGNGTNATDDIHGLMSDVWSWQMYMNPVSASQRGLTEYNDRMEQYGLDQFDIQKNKTQEFMVRLEAIDRTRLNRTNKINFDVFNDTLETFLEGNAWARYGAVNPINNFGTMQTPYKSATANKEADFEDFITRLYDVPALIDGLKTLMRFAIRLNRTLHNISMTSVVPSLDYYIDKSSLTSTGIFNDQLNSSTVEMSKRWTRSDAVQYLMKCTAWSQAAAEGEIDRCISMPGQACAYKIGEIKIKELRTLAQNELGSKFDIKSFHKVVLENGPMSLRLLETTVKDWILDEKTRHSVSGAPELLYHTHSIFTLLVAVFTCNILL